MAIEAERGCGYRKKGGLYLVSGKLSEPCHRLPVPFNPCPHCEERGIQCKIVPARGWTWIDSSKFLAPGCEGKGAFLQPASHCSRCVFCTPSLLEGKKSGLLWVGERHYKSTLDFTREAERLGISRRINNIPREFKIGETFVFLAHKSAILPDKLLGEENQEPTPGLFSAFIPTAIEIIITESESKDPDFMKSIEDRGLSPVIVPDDDPDHCPENGE